MTWPASCSTGGLLDDCATPVAGISHFLMRMLRDRNLYGTLAFAETAESLHLNVTALQTGHGDRIAGVTSSGDLLLALLARGPDEIRGFDANPAQTALAQLKAAAISCLPVDDYLRLMGVSRTDAPTRRALFAAVNRTLPAGHAQDLPLRARQIGDGILNLGMTHLMVGALVSLCRSLLGRDTAAQLLGSTGTDDDRRATLDRLQANGVTRYAIRPLLTCLAPGLKWLFFPHRFCRISRRPDEIIADPLRAFRGLLVRGLRSNPVLCRAATGHLHPEWTHYLYNDAVFQAIRTHCPRLTLASVDILSGLRRIDDGWATRVYLSNVPDYLSVCDLQLLIAELRRATAPGARIVYYSLYEHDLLHALGTPLPDRHLRALRQQDTVGLYPLIMVRTAGTQ